jgi:hypothetical protein
MAIATYDLWADCNALLEQHQLSSREPDHDPESYDNLCTLLECWDGAGLNVKWEYMVVDNVPTWY